MAASNVFALGEMSGSVASCRMSYEIVPPGVPAHPRPAGATVAKSALDEPDLSAKPDLTRGRDLGLCRYVRPEVWFQPTPEKQQSRDTVGTMSRDNGGFGKLPDHRQ